MPQATTAGDGSKDQAASPGGVRPERRRGGRNPRGRLRGICFQGDKSRDVRSAPSTAPAKERIWLQDGCHFPGRKT